MSPYEIEQKYRLRRPAAVRRKLRTLGARRLRAGEEFNDIYDLFGFLRAQKAVLRLRHYRRKDGLITLKGPRLPGRYKKRMELNLPVGDRRSAKAILEFLGFKRVTNYRKKREEYRLGKALVTLDFLPKKGWYLEIEAKPSHIEALRKKLGVPQKDREERTYLEILKKPC